MKASGAVYVPLATMTETGLRSGQQRSLGVFEYLSLSAAIVFGSPLAVLVLGLALAWVVRGFNGKPV